MCLCVYVCLVSCIVLYLCLSAPTLRRLKLLTSRLSESHVKAYVESSESPESSDLEKAKKAEYV